MYVKLLDPAGGEPCNPLTQGSSTPLPTDQHNGIITDMSHHRISNGNMAARQVQPVDQDWEFKQADKDDSSFLPVAQFPTMIHLDLLAHKLIADPNIGKNELDCQWVGEKAWVYRTKFETPLEAAINKTGGANVDGGVGAKVVLAFAGLDTFATVVLNGHTILETDNMFIPERVDVTKHMSEGVNELVITFDSAYLRGWERVDKHPDHVWDCWNGDVSRLAVRKSQYHWVSAGGVQ